MDFPLKRVVLQRGYDGTESSAVALACTYERIPYRRIGVGDPLPCEDCVPVGTVEFVEQHLPAPPVPDYAPEFLQSLLRRKTWIARSRDEVKLPCFVKPADRYKRFDGFVAHERSEVPDGPLFCSETIPDLLQHEWRYYVAGGVVLASGWYDGLDMTETPDAPPIPLSLPNHYYGALDMGMTREGYFLLIESHHPYACGWYGALHGATTYLSWLMLGWQYMLESCVQKEASP